jgi:uncharacterized protein (DUF302 family)
MTGPFSISVDSTLGVEECLGLLRQKLQQQELRIVTQIQFHREFEKSLGVCRQKYTVLVILSPFHAYQALLCGLDGGLFLPFNVLVAEDASSTLISTTNHSFAGLSNGPIAIQVLVRELNRMMWQIFQEIVVCGSTENRAMLAGTQ